MNKITTPPANRYFSDNIMESAEEGLIVNEKPTGLTPDDCCLARPELRFVIWQKL